MKMPITFDPWYNLCRSIVEQQRAQLVYSLES